MEIFPATSAHYQGIAAIINSLYPETHTSALEIAEADKRRDPKFKFQRWIAIEQDQVVGAGSFNQSIWFAHPQNFMLWIGVQPERQGHGIGSTLYEAILHGLHPYDPLKLRATATEDRLHSIRFLEKRGFHEVIRDVRSKKRRCRVPLSQWPTNHSTLRGCWVV